MAGTLGAVLGTTLAARLSTTLSLVGFDALRLKKDFFLLGGGEGGGVGPGLWVGVWGGVVPLR